MESPLNSSMSSSSSSLPSSLSVVLKRPRVVTLIALLLGLIGVGANAYFALDTVHILSRGRGTWLDRSFMLYLHLLWLALAVAAWGLWRGARWSRNLLVACFLGLLLITTFPSFDLEMLVTHGFFYCLILWLVFRPVPNAYFAARAKAVGH